MTDREISAVAQVTTDTSLHCLHCGYNLTGLPGNKCPECGNPFDREELLRDPEMRRIGTPVHRARGLFKIPALALTLLQVAFVPWKFARQFRVDESKFPALLVLLFSSGLGGWIMGGWRLRHSYYVVATILGALTVVVPCSLLLSLLSTSSGSTHWRARHRRAVYSAFVCYISWFMLAWLIVCPIRFSNWNDPWFYWPFIAWPYYQEEAIISSLFFYWWIVIVYSFVLVRTRPKMLAIFLLPLVVVLGRLAFLVYDSIIPRLAR